VTSLAELSAHPTASLGVIPTGCDLPEVPSGGGAGSRRASQWAGRRVCGPQGPLDRLQVICGRDSDRGGYASGDCGSGLFGF
jgi:hypothetical protein